MQRGERHHGVCRPAPLQALARDGAYKAPYALSCFGTSASAYLLYSLSTSHLALRRVPVKLVSRVLELSLRRLTPMSERDGQSCALLSKITRYPNEVAGREDLFGANIAKGLGTRKCSRAVPRRGTMRRTPRHNRSEQRWFASCHDAQRHRRTSHSKSIERGGTSDGSDRERQRAEKTVRPACLFYRSIPVSGCFRAVGLYMRRPHQGLKRSSGLMSYFLSSFQRVTRLTPSACAAFCLLPPASSRTLISCSR